MTTPNAQLTTMLRASSRALLFTGAGISTASGIADYRGPQGVWKRRQPVYYQDFMSSRDARYEYWDYKLEGWQSFRHARPNAVHDAVAALERAGKVRLVLTQNVDGLHRVSGIPDDRLVEIHGSNLLIECQRCGETSEPEPHFRRFEATREPPHCHCGGYLKPATISFGQSLRATDLERSAEAASECDLVIALGSTLSVYPAAEFPLRAARRGVDYVVINRGATDHDGRPEVSLRLEGDLLALFPPAVAAALSP